MEPSRYPTGSMIQIRPLRTTDSLEELTELLHRAYAPWAEAGMKFVASHQSVEVTKERCERGFCFVAELEREVVGTITLYRPDVESQCEFYRNPQHFHFGQFAVDPGHQGNGIGQELLIHAEAQARSLGGKYLALDTSERAASLISFYNRLGFVQVAMMNWGDIVNYSSVILAKQI